LVVQKAGYVTSWLRQSLATETEFPAATITLVRIPPGRGLYFVGPGGYQPIATCRVVEREKEKSAWRRTLVYSIQGNPTVIPAGQLQFADTLGVRQPVLGTSREVELFKLSQAVVIGSRTESWAGYPEGRQFDVVPVQKQEISTGFVFRTAAVERGVYAFVAGGEYGLAGVGLSAGGGSKFGHVDPVRKVYCFRSSTESTGQREIGGTSLQQYVVTVYVSATRRWTATSVFVKRGDRITISAKGSGHPCVQSTCADRRYMRWVGPEGFVNLPRQLNAYPQMALIGRIGGLKPFYIGRGTVVVAPVSARLYLGVNDSLVSDNAGTFEVRVTVAR
jgi:hypothetical protein